MEVLSGLVQALLASSQELAANIHHTPTVLGPDILHEQNA